MPHRRHAVHKGDVWAFKDGLGKPLAPVQVMNDPPRHDAVIQVMRVFDPSRRIFGTKRIKLACRWDDLDAYLDAHPAIPRALPPLAKPDPQSAAADAADLFSVGQETIRRIVREELQAARGVPKIALNYEEAAYATGYSVSTLYALVDRGELVPSYANRKPVFLVEELERWLRSLPPDAPG